MNAITVEGKTVNFISIVNNEKLKQAFQLAKAQPKATETFAECARQCYSFKCGEIPWHKKD